MARGDEALARWADFPVAARPRPSVVVDGYVRVGPSGFESSDAKMAFLDGAINSQVQLPDGVSDLLDQRVNGQRRRSGRTLTITALARTETQIETDRGPRRLPAYALDTDGTREPIIVLDPTTPVWWPEQPTQESTSGGLATIEADGVTLHVLAHGGLLTEFLECPLTESRSAVLAEPLTRERNAGGRAVHAIGKSMPVTGRLTKPLGNRVLINFDGRPIPVRPARQPGQQ